MSTYTQILYQIVFLTKNKDKSLIGSANRVKLYKYIRAILANKQCVVYKVNGINDHVHIATHIHPSQALSSVVKDIKVSTSLWIKQENIFPNFRGWQIGYGAFTYSIDAKEKLVNYINNQESHHSKTSFREEYIKLLNDHNIKFDEKYLL